MTASSSKIQGYFYYQQRSFNKSRLDQFAWLKRWNILFLCLSIFFFFKTRSQISFGASVFQQQLAKKKKKASASLKSHLEKRDGVSSNKSSKHARHGDIRLSWKVCAAQRAHSEREESSNTGDFCSFCMSLMHVWCNSGQEASNPSPWHIYCNGWYDMNRNKRWDWGGCRALCCFGGWK